MEHGKSLSESEIRESLSDGFCSVKTFSFNIWGFARNFGRARKFYGRAHIFHAHAFPKHARLFFEQLCGFSELILATQL